MKVRNIIIGLMAFAAFTWSCEDNEPVLRDFSDIAYYTSQARTEKHLWAANVTDFISFSNLSRNPISHQWTIPGGGAAFFLEGPINMNDTILTEFIINPGDTITEEETIHVLFTMPGLQTVTLRNVFRDSVAFVGRDTISAVSLSDGTWLYEEDFVIDVYDSIVGNARIFRLDGTEIPLGTDTIEVEGSDTLRFVDISTGRPNAWSWRIGSASGTDSASNIILNLGLGVYTANLQANRSGEHIPSAFGGFTIPNPIKIVPSSQPFQLAGPIVELEDQTIQVPLSGAISSPIPAGQEAFFSVTVNGDPYNVTSVQIDPNDNTLLNITLAGTIYSDDEIFVSLASGNNITATDSREIVPFNNEPVTMFVLNLLEVAGVDFSFDNGINGFDDVNYFPRGGNAERFLGNSSIEYAPNEGVSGGALKVNLDALPDEANFQFIVAEGFGMDFVEGAQYAASFDYRIVGPMFEFTMRLYQEGSTRNISPGQSLWTNGRPERDWTSATGNFGAELDSDVENGTLGIQVIGITDAAATLYLDNIVIFEPDFRP